MTAEATWPDGASVRVAETTMFSATGAIAERERDRRVGAAVGAGRLEAGQRRPQAAAVRRGGEAERSVAVGEDRRRGRAVLRLDLDTRPRNGTSGRIDDDAGDRSGVSDQGQ